MIASSISTRSRRSNGNKPSKPAKNYTKCKYCGKLCGSSKKHKCNKWKIFTCDICKNTFIHYERLMSHIESHFKAKELQISKFFCDVCPKHRPSLHQLQMHIMRDHGGIKHDCKECLKSFLTEEKLARHVCKPLLCSTCNKVFATSYSLYKHEQFTHLFSFLRCKFCSATFLKEDNYNAHVSKLKCSTRARNFWLQTINPGECRECRNIFQSEEKLLLHFSEAHSGSPYQCFWCEAQLSTMKELKEHVHYHNVKNMTCLECNKVYTSQEGFRKHRMHHQRSEHRCQFCRYEYLSEKRVQLHETTCKYNPSVSGKPFPYRPNKKKLSRQLQWESRIIVKKIRGVAQDANLLQQESHSINVDDDGSLSDRQGWFDDYYKTADDDLINQSPADDLPTHHADDNFSDVETLGVPTAPSSSSEDDSGDEVEDVVDFNHKLCRLCGNVFELEYELLHHFVKTHPGEIPHQCPYCDHKSPLFAQLKEHLKMHGIGIGVFNCGYCSKAFRSEARGLKHKAKCRGEVTGWPATKACRRCGKIFHTKCGYKRHIRVACKKEAKIPKLREEVYSDGDSWHEDDPGPQHEENGTVAIQEQLVEAEPVVFTELLPVRKTLQEKQAEEPPFPEIKPPIPELMLKLPENQEFSCRICAGSSFRSERSVIMHFKELHPGVKPLVCDICGVTLSNKLKEHQKTHGIGEEFVCELCDKRFNQKFLSKVHEMWHQGIEYKCNNCKQKFLTQDKMTRHVTGGKCCNRQSLLKHPCEICGRFYKSLFGLRTHSLTHTPRDLRPVRARLSCEFCGKWFESNNALQRHRRIHTGEKPYCCRYCPRAFAQEGNCKAHEQIHTGEARRRRKKSEPAPEATVFVFTTLNPAMQ